MKTKKVKRVRKPKPLMDLDIAVECSVCEQDSDVFFRVEKDLLRDFKRLHRWLTKALIYLEQEEQK